MLKARVNDYFDHNSGNWSNNYKINKIFESRLRVFENLAISFYPPSGRLLDIGCGSGDIATRLVERNFRVIGADRSLRMVQVAKEDDVIKDLVNADINSLPFCDGFFDGALCSSVLEYIEDEQISIRELQRVIINQGIILISLPNKKSIWRVVEKVIYYLRKLFTNSPNYLFYQQRQHDCNSISVLLEKNQLNVISCNYFGSPNPLLTLFPNLARSLEKSSFFGTMIIIVAKKN
jgi:ubiquinone/menaquinone biosynthesis C-methylase UbiE